MKYAWLAALLIVALGATWSPGRDVVTLAVGVYLPDPPGVASTVYVEGADALVPVGSSRRILLDIDGQRVRVTITATAVK